MQRRAAARAVAKDARRTLSAQYFMEDKISCPRANTQFSVLFAISDRVSHDSRWCVPLLGRDAVPRSLARVVLALSLFWAERIYDLYVSTVSTHAPCLLTKEDLLPHLPSLPNGRCAECGLGVSAHANSVGHMDAPNLQAELQTIRAAVGHTSERVDELVQRSDEERTVNLSRLRNEFPVNATIYPQNAQPVRTRPHDMAVTAPVPLPVAPRSVVPVDAQDEVTCVQLVVEGQLQDALSGLREISVRRDGTVYYSPSPFEGYRPLRGALGDRWIIRGPVGSAVLRKVEFIVEVKTPNALRDYGFSQLFGQLIVFAQCERRGCWGIYTDSNRWYIACLGAEQHVFCATEELSTVAALGIVRGLLVNDISPPDVGSWLQREVPGPPGHGAPQPPDTDDLGNESDAGDADMPDGTRREPSPGDGDSDGEVDAEHRDSTHEEVLQRQRARRAEEAFSWYEDPNITELQFDASGALLLSLPCPG